MSALPVPLEQAPIAVELMVDGLLRGLRSLDTIIARPVGVPNRERTDTVYICCGDPADCGQTTCKEPYDHWYREGPRP